MPPAAADRGSSIEAASMAVIEAEIGEHGYGREEWPVVRRIIHATADFDFARGGAVVFGRGAVGAGLEALGRGCRIVADVNGVKGLLSRGGMAACGSGAVCRIAEQGVAEAAAASAGAMTRAQASMRASAADMDGGIVAVGNAPTALLEVISMVAEGAARPALVVGLPVGFISAAESKAELEGAGVPFITNRGRKGGSPAAAAAVNALMVMRRGGGGEG